MSNQNIYGEYAQYLPKILQQIKYPIFAAIFSLKIETFIKIY